MFWHHRIYHICMDWRQNDPKCKWMRSQLCSWQNALAMAIYEYPQVERDQGFNGWTLAEGEVHSSEFFWRVKLQSQGYFTRELGWLKIRWYSSEFTPRKCYLYSLELKPTFLKSDGKMIFQFVTHEPCVQSALRLKYDRKRIISASVP